MTKIQKNIAITRASSVRYDYDLIVNRVVFTKLLVDTGLVVDRVELHWLDFLALKEKKDLSYHIYERFI